jgi:basic membrane lipoprotein Med (substrate-binding protein (PBP1-ABC) superfamily)
MKRRMFRLSTIVAMAAVLGIVAAACGGKTATTTPTTSAGGTTGTPAAAFKVAIVAPSAPNDLAFTQSMVDAVNSLKSQYNLEIAVSDSLFVVDDAAAAIRDYASKGFDLVIAHGSQYGATVQEIAPQFPDVSFAWGTAGDTFGLSNVFAYQAASDQGGYVMGQMAAALSKSGVIGVVGPIEVGDAKLYVDGFKNGAVAQKAAVDVKVNYTGSFSDVALASEAAKSFVQAGADVMTGSAQMVVGAVGVAQEDNVAWFGTQANQTSLAPNVVVASQVYHWEVVLSQMIDAIKGGTLGGKTYDITLANGGEVVELNPGYALPAEVKTISDTAINGIKDGSITTGVSA